MTTGLELERMGEKELEDEEGKSDDEANDSVDEAVVDNVSLSDEDVLEVSDSC